MASSTGSPPAHSCEGCQNLILYKRDVKWWRKALGTSPDVEAHIGGLLSIRARNWLLQNLAESEDYDRTSLDSLAHSLALYAIFDCTLGEARLAAEAGCNFCLAVTSRLPEYRQFHYDNHFLAGTLHGGFGTLTLPPSDLTGRNGFLFSSSEHFEILALPDDPASEEILRRPVNSSPSSKDSFHQVRQWLEECLETHQTCPKPTGKFMPTRVLEIVKLTSRNYYQLRLKETTSMAPEPYAALSYCWGGHQNITTTNESYRRHLVIIDKQVLPASVSDAVSVADNIGIRYLWIDAFCIIQDDQNDKNWEIVQMPLIYRHAAVTIVASRAKEVSEGFLHERPRMGADTPNQVFELAFRCSDNRLGSVVLLPHIKPPTEPLDLRAWPLQERFLSPCIIEYGSLQTRWICQTLSGYTSPVDGFKSTTVDNEERSDDLFTRAIQQILATPESTPSDKRRYSLLNNWDNVLEIYTHRALTFGTDRLPAISGIAAHFGKSLRDEYKAGLWRSDMESQLLWKRAKSFYPGNDLKLRPLKYQGPSWSWAAINEPISPRYCKVDGDCHVDFGVVDYNIKTHSTSENFSVYDPSFGAVESASLQLKGRLGLVECMYVKGIPDIKLDQWTFKNKHDTRPEEALHGSFYLDALEAEFANGSPGSIPVYLLFIISGRSGLILRCIEGSLFSRLGIFDFRSLGGGRHKEQVEWLNSCPIEIITLI